MKAFAVIGWLAFSCLTRALDVQVTAHRIEMKQETMTSLLAAGDDGQALFDNARKRVAAKAASLFDTSVIRAKAGGKAVSESVSEVISPTEPEPPEGVPGAGTPTGQPVKSHVPPLRMPEVATAFETRNVGITMECGVTIHGDEIDLLLCLDHSFHPRNLDMNEPWTDLLGNTCSKKRPLFVDLKHEGSCTLTAGKWHFASVQSGHDPDGTINPDRKILLFLRADVLRD